MTQWLFSGMAVATILLCYVILYLWRRRGEAHRDLLTGLANRDFYERYLQHCAARAARLGPRYGFAVVLIELDGFEDLRRAFGRLAVDEIIADFAERVFWCVRPSDVMARLGVDAFGLVLDDIGHVADAARVAMRVRASLTEAAMLSGRETAVSLSVGITMSRVGTVLDAPELIADARAALDAARGAGRPYVVFDEGLDVAAREWLALEQVVSTGRVGEEFDIRFVPIVDGRTLAIRGFGVTFERSDQSVATIDPTMVDRVIAHSYVGKHLVEAAVAQALALIDAWAQSTEFERVRFIEIRIGSFAVRPEPILKMIRDQIAARGTRLPLGALRLSLPAEALVVAGPALMKAVAALRTLDVGVHIEIAQDRSVPLQLLAEIRPAAVRLSLVNEPRDVSSPVSPGANPARLAERHTIDERIIRSLLADGTDVIIGGLDTAQEFAWVTRLNLDVLAQGRYVSDTVDAGMTAHLLEAQAASLAFMPLAAAAVPLPASNQGHGDR